MSVAPYESNGVPFLVIEDGEQPTSVGLELKVWSKDDPTVLVNVVARRQEPQYLSEHNRDGGGSFKIRVDDEAFADTPHLLDEGNLVEVIDSGRTVGWWEIASKPRETIPVGEHAEEFYDVSGPGLLQSLEHGIVYPYGGTRRTASESRTFNFAGAAGAWLDPAEWSTPVVVPASTWPGYPAPVTEQNQQGWPVTSSWVWDRDSTSGAPVGDVFLRKTFSTTGTKQVRVYATCDDVAGVYLDGEPVVTITEFYAWQRSFQVDLDLGPGEHVLAVRGRNRNGDRAGVNVAVVEMPSSGEVGDQHRLAWTGSAGWLIRAYPATAPGWSCGLVMATLVDEAVARGVRTLSYLDLNFDGDADTYGAPWQDALDWQWSVGTSVREVATQFAETVSDVWVDGARRLCMAPQRGFDRSLQNAGMPPVVFAKGLNVVKASTESQAEIINTLLMKTADGWSEVHDNAGSIERFGRRESYLSAVGASEDGTAPYLAGQVFTKYGRPRRSPTIEIAATDDCLPWRDFSEGDWVLAPDDDDPDQLVRRRVMSIAVAEDADTGLPRYSIELDTIEEQTQERIVRWLGSISNGSLNGGVSGAQSGTSSAGLGGTAVAPAGTPGPPGLPGPVGIAWRGAWSAAVEYAPRDAVTHQGSSWVAAAGSVGVTPVAGAYWTVLAAGGPPGPPGPAGSIAPRAVTSVVTSSIDVDATWTGIVPLAPGYRLYRIATSHAARVRLYATAAQRAADVLRPVGSDPLGDHGLMFEYVTTAAALAAGLSPLVDGALMENVLTNDIPITITNLSQTARAITVTLTWARTE